MSSEINRRESFRLDDTLMLRIRIPSQESLEEIIADFNAFRMRYCIKSHAQNQKDIHQPKLMQIRKRYPDVAAYFEYLETRLMQVVEQVERLDLNESGQDVHEEICTVNLSAVGIRFDTALNISLGQTIEIGLLLHTSGIQVIMLGEVVRVGEGMNDKSEITAKFTHIHFEDSEAIVKHMMKLQNQQLRASRSN